MTEHGQIKFLKPNLDYSSNLQTERLNEIESELELVKFNTFSNLALDVQRKQLPIYKYREQILYALETHRVVVVGELFEINFFLSRMSPCTQVK